MQSYCVSNFENILSLSGLKPRPNALAHTFAVMAEVADFFLRPPTLTDSNFAALGRIDPTYISCMEIFKYLILYGCK